MRVKVGSKANYFSYLMSSCTDRTAAFNDYSELKQKCACFFLLLKYFEKYFKKFSNLLLVASVQNARQNRSKYWNKKGTTDWYKKCRHSFVEESRKSSIKKVFLKISQNSKGNTCARVSFLIKLQAWGIRKNIRKETLAQVFSCEFCEFLQKTVFYRTPPLTVSGILLEICLQRLIPSTHHSEIPY